MFQKKQPKRDKKVEKQEAKKAESTKARVKKRDKGGMEKMALKSVNRMRQMKGKDPRVSRYSFKILR